MQETRRCLRVGGIILAEIITRHAWILDAAKNELLATAGIWDHFDRNITTGLSQDPDHDTGQGFFAFFHTPDQITAELVGAGFEDVDLVAVEGFGWLLGDLPRRMAEPDDLLRAIRLTEREPSMLGASAHVIATATSPAADLDSSDGEEGRG